MTTSASVNAMLASFVQTVGWDKARILWVPIALSWPLTWSLVLDEGRPSGASGCLKTSQSGTVGTCVTAIRLPGGAARVRLACPTRPLRPRQGHREPDLATPGRCAPVPGPGPAAVLGRPGCIARSAGPKQQIKQINSVFWFQLDPGAPVPHDLARCSLYRLTRPRTARAASPSSTGPPTLSTMRITSPQAVITTGK